MHVIVGFSIQHFQLSFFVPQERRLGPKGLGPFAAGAAEEGAANGRADDI